MAEALFYGLLTGLSWAAIGIVLKCCARGNFDVVCYSLMQSALAGSLCFVFYTDCHAASGASVLKLAAVILLAAALNSLAQYLVKTAMNRDGGAPVWSMAQAAMLFPFLAGIICFGGKASPGNWAGLLLILCGVFLPAWGRFQKVRGWYRPAIAALLCYGMLQILYLLPSHLPGFADPGSWRPVLVCAGNFLGWSAIGAVRKESLKFSRSAFYTALGMAVVHAACVRTFFCALDSLSAFHRGGLGIPLMTGVSLAGFGLFSWFRPADKRSPRTLVSALLILAGILLLARI